MTELEKLKTENERLKRELLGARTTIENLNSKLGRKWWSEKMPRKRKL